MVQPYTYGTDPKLRDEVAENVSNSARIPLKRNVVLQITGLGQDRGWAYQQLQG